MKKGVQSDALKLDMKVGLLAAMPDQSFVLLCDPAHGFLWIALFDLANHLFENLG